MDFAADLPLFYSEFAVAVTHTPLVGAPATARALFDQPGTAIINGEILATDYTLRYSVATFPGVKRGDTFTIAGNTYTARENAQPMIDGAEYVVPLARAA